MNQNFKIQECLCTTTAITFILLVLSINLRAQEFPIMDGLETTCAGIFLDDGTGEGAPYIPGNSYTFTLCPDNPGDVITVEFVAFALYTSPNPNNSDYLSIFDGDSDSAPSMGSYTGNSLQGLPVTGTINNLSGCLTFSFTSNPNGSGTFPGWEGNIGCTTPCAIPIAASEISDPAPQGAEQSIGVCLDAPVTFSDIGSTADAGFNLEYWVWNYDDGTLDTLENPGDAVHTFTEPGEYLVTLSVIDNNGCRSLNIDPLQVLVSTIPVFNTNFNSPVCLDEINQLDGSPVQSVTWTALPPQVVAGETYLADGAGFSYSSTLTFDFFEPGASLDDCDDLLDVFVNMEHSYLGDLQMSITCPDGTNVILLEYPNGGGGTFLGEAIDDGSQDPGNGYDYAWGPTNVNGNLSSQTNIPVGGGGTTPGNAVPPGTYESDYDMCDLVGCPLNGDWTFNVLDNLAIDNGFIFAWGINFNPLLFPDITTFTPIVGLQSDSTWWEGPNIVNTSDDGNILDISFDTPGIYEYTFFATNNFGCTFDTTITVEAIEGPEISAGPDQVFCVDPVQLSATVTGGTPPPNGMVWSWSPPIGLSDPDIADPFATVSQNTLYTVTGYPVGLPGCLVTDQVVVALDALSDPGLDTDSVMCYNSPISFLVDYLDGTPAFGGDWTDPAGNIVPDMLNPTDYLAGANFVYTYTVGDANCIGQSTLELTILAATNLSCCQTNAVAGDDAFPCELSYQMQAEPTLGLGIWTGPPSISFSDINDPHAIATSNSQGGEVATLTWTDDNGLACSDFDEVTITFSDPLELMVVTEDALCHNQNSGRAIGIASGGTTSGGVYIYEWNPEYGYPGVIPQIRDSLLFGTYQVKVFDDVGCADSSIFVVSQPDPQDIFVTQAPPLCAEQCSGRIGIRSAGAIEYSFDGGESFVSDSTTFSCDGEYLVIARNENGCEIAQLITLIDPPPFEAYFHINPLPTTTKNTRITFQDISMPGPIQKSAFQYGNDPVIGEGDSRISVFDFPKDTSGTYPVTLTSTSIYGCTDTLTQFVVINDDLLWYIPNSFSPNEDGINDIWRPVGNTLDISDYQLTILDRWGRQVFSSRDYNQGWNGSSSNSDGNHYLDAGVYNYLIKVSSSTTEEKREITGFITLIR